MLRNISNLWLGALFLAGVLLSTGVFFERRRVFYEQRRQDGIRQTVRAAEPLLDAIHRYEERHQKPPESLEALALTLPAPSPMARYGWNYQAWETGWSLAIEVRGDYSPNYGFGDTLVYRSDGRYESHAYGGVLEKVGKWGYYWE